MNQLQQRGLRTLTLLEEKQWSIDELADKLCICRRYTQKIIKHLRSSGFLINSVVRNRIRFFWAKPDECLFFSILSPTEQLAISEVLTGSNPPLQAAIYKLAQCTNIQTALSNQR